MGALADGALSRRGRVVGVMPRFMQELEWGHTGISELQIVDDMRTRRHLMLAGSSAVVALPGGTGTLEELLEAMTLKRLGIFLGPIVLVNTRGFFEPLITLLSACVSERFMDQRHLAMWDVVDHSDDVPHAIATAARWSTDARGFAAV